MTTTKIVLKIDMYNFFQQMPKKLALKSTYTLFGVVLNANYLVLFLFKITPTIISANPINTIDNPVHNKKRLLLSPYNIKVIPKHCKTNPSNIKVIFFMSYFFLGYPLASFYYSGFRDKV